MTKEEKFEILIDLQSLLEQASQTCKTAAITVGFQITHNNLIRMAQRVIELQTEEVIKEDDVLIKGFKQLNYIKEV